jgi:uncharacterized protein (UPF0333 family)
MRRGQAALEFIMTYGWAIIAVLAAIGALAYFGVLSPSKYLPDKCVFTTGIGCKDFSIQHSGANDLLVRFTVSNNLGDGMILGTNNVSAIYRNTGASCGPAASVTIPVGGERGFNCTFVGMSPGVGQAAKVSVDMNYTLVQGVYKKSAHGDLSSTVQG